MKNDNDIRYSYGKTNLLSGANDSKYSNLMVQQKNDNIDNNNYKNFEDNDLLDTKMEQKNNEIENLNRIYYKKLDIIEKKKNKGFIVLVLIITLIIFIIGFKNNAIDSISNFSIILISSFFISFIGVCFFSIIYTLTIGKHIIEKEDLKEWYYKQLLKIKNKEH